MKSMEAVRNVVRHPTISLVETCKRLTEIKQVHTQLIVAGLLNDPFLVGQFLASLVIKRPNDLDYATLVLDQCHNPTAFAFNTMIRAHSKTSNPLKSFIFYKRILHSNNKLIPDNYTFNFLVRACAQLFEEAGSAVHAVVVRRGFQMDPHLQSGLVYMYAEVGFLDSSLKVFAEIPKPDLVTQTAMLVACARSGRLDFAQEVFDKMPVRDTISWTAMISGYAQGGLPMDALRLFNSMQLQSVEVNEASMVSVLSACTQLGAIEQGRWAHAYIERHNLPMTVTLGTSLVDMYAKCGDIEMAMSIFWRLMEKNVYTWSSAMGGLAMNGLGNECLELFSLMKREGVKPNEVTFISILKGCSVAGLVDEGCRQFDSMIKDYGFVPMLEHYGCMVDLYGRAGLLMKALDFINKMPIQPHAGAWGALLNACKIHGDMELGEIAARKIVELEAKNHGAYVVLSNIYADSHEWDKVGTIRKSMMVKGVEKIPGFSVIS
ncbi:putative pentatricopeptide repeat-containing protein At5g40405 [Impatiens glandulifera]|uniref:putative pentatricopeptide repeat-containing protein At5g40405 n=1 Tax=Impatiens glandulifera TaxID=253017 RepID=UPI001FB0CB65|nr:putative pentatricopeptide repeat-containing protein At5g40405 [Impatiens glandulifera]